MYRMFVVGTLGLGMLYLLSSLMVVLAVGSLYGAAVAQVTALACSVLGVFAGVIIGSLLSGGFKHPLQSQLETVVREASTRRRVSGRYGSRADSPYVREKDAPTYGDEGVAVSPGSPHDHTTSWKPQPIGAPPPSSSPYEAPSFDAPSSASASRTSIGKDAFKRASAMLDQVPMTQMQQRVQAGDVEGALELGRKTYESTRLDELYAELPGLLATYRSGGGRALLGQLSDRAREIAEVSSGQTQADVEQLGELFGLLETLSPSEVPVATWIKVLGGVKQMRTNPRAFVKTVVDALGAGGSADA